MANKDRNKRSARQARARERAELAAAQAASNPSNNGSKKSSKPIAKAQAARPERAAAKDAKPGFFARIKKYFADVRTEMHRVVWPSRTELKNYSVAVIATLIVFGFVIWAVDTGFVALLVAFTSLKGA